MRFLVLRIPNIEQKPLLPNWRSSRCLKTHELWKRIFF